jgi:hypothetical protein
MRGVHVFFAAVLVLAAAMLVATVATPAADRGVGSADPILPHAEIVGTWEATVDRGPALPSLTSLHTFTDEHTMIESGNDTLFRSPGFGVWKFVGDHTYATTMVLHRFNSAGAAIGSVKVNANRKVAADGQSYVGVGVNEIRDLQGNVIAVGRSTVTGRRMQLEQIPDLP